MTLNSRDQFIVVLKLNQLVRLDFSCIKRNYFRSITHKSRAPTEARLLLCRGVLSRR